jgi:hypothetical protein
MNQIDDLLILGFSFTEQQLKDLHAAVIVALSIFENNPVDPNKALQDRLIKINERIEYFIERKQAYK